MEMCFCSITPRRTLDLMGSHPVHRTVLSILHHIDLLYSTQTCSPHSDIPFTVTSLARKRMPEVLIRPMDLTAEIKAHKPNNGSAILVCIVCWLLAQHSQQFISS